MRTILHIVTREDALSRDIVERQRTLADVKIEVMPLTTAATDYDLLIEKIFTADSIEVF